jgi:hypothetical protein
MSLPEWVDTVVVGDHVDGVGLPALEPYVAAAAAFVERVRPDLFAAVDAPAPASDVQLGVALLAGRLWARRGTALGTADYEAGVASVLRTDPDVSRLLGLAWHGMPGCG